jgi:ATP-dependent DNA ligase
MYFYPAKPKLITLRQPLFQKLNSDPNFIAELKYNGDRLELITPDGGKTFEWWNRHGSRFHFTPSKRLLETSASLRLKGICQLDGELIDHKTKDVKDTAMLFDVIVYNGQVLVNRTLEERKEILWDVFGKPEEVFDMPEEGVNMTPQWPAGEFQDVYDLYTKVKWIEGLVMKDLKAKLIVGRTSCPVVTTMYKVRKRQETNPLMRW